MGSYHDDFEEFDELNFDHAAASRRAPREKSCRESRRGERKHKRRVRDHRRDVMGWDENDDYDHYVDVEFDMLFKKYRGGH